MSCCKVGSTPHLCMEGVGGMRQEPRYGPFARLGAAVLCLVFSFAVRGEALTSRGGINTEYGRFPLLFMKNMGQSSSQVDFTVHGKDKTVHFTPEGVAFSLAVAPNNKKISSPGGGRVLKLDFIDAAKVHPRGEHKADTLFSYFRGPAEEHISGAPTYGRLVYSSLWPGVDLMYDGDSNRLKYQFVVHPGASPDDIRLAWRGAECLSIDDDGGLEIRSPSVALRDDRPVAWQEADGSHVPVDVAYCLGAPEKPLEYGFSVGAYDPSKPLTIDPAMLVYCGFIGGKMDDVAFAIAVDDDGCAYVTGKTNSTKDDLFPVTTGPCEDYNKTYGNYYSDVFVAKVKADGTGLEYCGYIGGELDDVGMGIAVDDNGCAYVAGYTQSNNTTHGFPATTRFGEIHPWQSYISDTFVAKVSADGTRLEYCGYIGGTGEDQANAIAVDASHCAYVTGCSKTIDGSFPVSGDLGTENQGNNDVFVAKVNASGTALEYCGFIGGSGDDSARGIAVDTGSCAYVAGNTYSSDFPFKNGPSTTYGSGSNAFIAKISEDGSELVYCGYIGGKGGDYGRAVSVDPWGCAYITGQTSSTAVNFPAIVGPCLQNKGLSDAFIAKVNADGTKLEYCGFIGGSNYDFASGIAVEDDGSAYITGYTSSNNMPVVGDPDTSYGGGKYDAFVAKVSPDGTALEFCRYLGGSKADCAYGIAVSKSGYAYVAGLTKSLDFPVHTGPCLEFRGKEDEGGDPDKDKGDAFVAKIGKPLPPTPEPDPEPTPTPEPGPVPTPTPDPTPTPYPGPGPAPSFDQIPTPLRAAASPPTVPTEGMMADGVSNTSPDEVFVVIPNGSTPEQRLGLIAGALVARLGMPSGLAREIAPLLGLDENGRLYVSAEAAEDIIKLLDLETPDGGGLYAFALFSALLPKEADPSACSNAGADTALLFYEMPDELTGKRVDSLRVIKLLGDGRAELFRVVCTLKEIADMSCAFVQVDVLPGGKAIKRVLREGEMIGENCLIALAIRDGGEFDMDGKRNGLVADPALLVEVKQSNRSSGSGGCTAAGAALHPSILLLLIPVCILLIRQK